MENLESSCQIIVSTSEGVTCNNQIININQEVDKSGVTGIDKERRVCIGCNKAEREQGSMELLVPSSGSLFEPINSLV